MDTSVAGTNTLGSHLGAIGTEATTVGAVFPDTGEHGSRLAVCGTEHQQSGFDPNDHMAARSCQADDAPQARLFFTEA